MKQWFNMSSIALIGMALVIMYPSPASHADGKKWGALFGGIAAGVVLNEIYQNKLRQGANSQQVGSSTRIKHRSTAGNAYLGRKRLAQAQHALATLSYYNLDIDGMDGPGTRAAVRRFQSGQGYPVTGKLTPLQFEALLAVASSTTTSTIRSGSPSTGSGASQMAGSLPAADQMRNLVSNDVGPSFDGSNAMSNQGGAALDQGDVGTSTGGASDTNIRTDSAGTAVTPVAEDGMTTMIRQYRDAVDNYNAPGARAIRCQLGERLLNSYGQQLQSRSNALVENILHQLSRDRCYG